VLAAVPADRPPFPRFSGRFGVKMTAVLAEVLGAHAALIKKCGQR
jgi:hypothetical protein